MEPDVVAQHEHDAAEEGEVVSEQGREHVPGRLLHLPEPDAQQAGVLHEGEGEVEQVLQPGLLLLGVKEGKDVDGAEDEGEQELLADGVAGGGPLEDDPGGHHQPVRGTKGAYTTHIVRGIILPRKKS